MKMRLICDNKDTLCGLRLVGIDGTEVSCRDELEAELKDALRDKDVGILLITESLSAHFPDIISEVRLGRTLPLIVEIPDRHGTSRSADFITSYVKDAIGVKL
jgi:V/A-type H+-transporting ATPase subunit F